MANEVFVVFRGPMPAIEAVDKAIGSFGYAIALSDPSPSFDAHSGFLPMRLSGKDSGVELSVFDDREDIEDIESEFDLEPGFERIASFRWASSYEEGFLAYCGAAALARLTSGHIVDEHEGIISIDQALATARTLLDERDKGG